MKHFIFIIIILICVSCFKETSDNRQEVSATIRMGTTPSVVDTLQDHRSIELFLYERDTNYYSFQLRKLGDFVDKHNPEFEKEIHSYAVKNNLDKAVYKADFDNNGYTDMLLTGAMLWPREQPPGENPQTILVLNYGGHTAKVLPLTSGLFTSHLMCKLSVRDNIPLIQTELEKNSGERAKKEKDETIFLTVKDSALIEYNASPKEYNIEKIQFAASPCMGTCSIFEIHIDKYGNAIFLADAYNFTHSYDGPKEEKAFKVVLNEKIHTELTALIKYIDFPNLSNEYTLGYTDLPSADLIITYNGGKVKRISDYGLNGTFGLRRLYKRLKELRFNQKWIEITEPESIRINTWIKD